MTTEEENKELKRKLELANELFRAASALLAKLGDPTDPKNKKIESQMLALEHATWRYAA